jgi:hypothetical protein
MGSVVRGDKSLMSTRITGIYRRLELIVQHPSPKLIAILGAATFTVIIGLQLTSFSRNTASSYLPETNVTAGDTHIKWTFNSGADKPVIRWPDTTETEISGWASTITTSPGETRTLWSHYLGVSSTSDTIYASYLLPDWYLLEQEIVAASEDRILLNYYFTPKRPLNSVELTLGHYRGDWRDATKNRDEIVLRGPDRELKIKIEGSLIDVKFYENNGLVDEIDNGSVDHVDIEYGNSDIGARYLIAKETIQFKSMPSAEVVR